MPNGLAGKLRGLHDKSDMAKVFGFRLLSVYRKYVETTHSAVRRQERPWPLHRMTI